MNSENIEYRCSAACEHNGRTDTRTYSPCHLKNNDLKKDKNTSICYGNKCGFFVDNTKYDYEGYAVRYDVELPNGKTVHKDAFKIRDGQTVPLVYKYYKDGGTHVPDTSIDNVLGEARLENRDEGIYARCILFNTPICLELKKVGLDKCIKELTVFARACEVHEQYVTSGIIMAVKVISM